MQDSTDSNTVRSTQEGYKEALKNKKKAAHAHPSTLITEGDDAELESKPEVSHDYSLVENHPPPIKALRLPKVLEKTGLSRTHTYRLIKRDDHPKPFKLSERVFVWNEADIDAWLEAKFSGGES